MFNVLKQKWFPWLIYAIVFLLPWQTRYIFGQKMIHGQPFEYGVLSIYAVELLIIAAFFFGQRLSLLDLHRKSIAFIGVALLATAVSIPFSVNPDLSFLMWTHLVIAAMLFVLLLDRRVDTKRTLMAFVAGLVIPSILGIVQVYSGWSPSSSWLGLASHQATTLGASVVEGMSERFLRAYGTFSHPNVFGGYLAMGLLSALILNKRRLAVSLIPFLSFTLILTFSRSAWLAFVFALVVHIGFMILKHRCKTRAILPVVGLIILSLSLSVGIFSQEIFGRFQSDSTFEQQSINDRVSQYKAYPSIVDHHLIVGVGLGAYTIALANTYPAMSIWDDQPIHNAALLIFAETGILGVLAVILWAASVDKINYAAIRKGSIGAIGGIALGSVLLVVTFFDHYLWSSWSGLALMAFAMAMTLRLSED